MAAVLGLSLATTTTATFSPPAVTRRSLPMAAGAAPDILHPPNATKGRVVLASSAPAPTSPNGDDDDIVFPMDSPRRSCFPILPIGRRQSLATACFAVLTLSVGQPPAKAAILEADDDEELLERVKKDRKRRIERQGVISSSGREAGYLQELVYKLSKVGQAIDNNDLSAASSVLGPNTSAVWVQNANTAFTKLSTSPDEKIEVDTFNSSLVSLISSVAKNDVESSKLAFVSSASALEKWITLTGLVGQLKGL